MSPIQPPIVSKRLKIVCLVIGLAVLMFGALQLPVAFAQLGVGLLTVAAYAATVIGLDRDLRREEWIVLPLYSILAVIIYFAWMSTIVSSTITALLAAVGVGLIMYGLILTQNIINISTVRTIPLARPANTVLSLAGLAGSFGLFYLTSINQPQMVIWILAVGGSSLLVAWPLAWVSQGPKQRFQRSIGWAALSAILLMQIAAVLSFWPSSYTSSLFMAIILLLILGMFHLQQKRQLSLEIKRQYLMLGGIATLILTLLAQW